MISVVFADDHPIARAGIRALLSEAQDIEILGMAENGDEVMQLVRQLRPQVLLLDLKMPGPPPVEIERWVRKNFPETVTLILTAHDRDSYLAGMMEAGAAGLFNKDISADRLIGAIRRAVQGEILFDESQYRRAERWRKVAGERWASLTPREQQVLCHLVQGSPKLLIASDLDISPKTVNFHIANLLKKLEVGGWAHKYLSDDQVKLPG